MKTIVEINNNNYGSTGTIMLDIATKARENNYKIYTFCKNSKEGHKYNYQDQYYIGIWLERIISEKLCFLTSLNDHFNIFGTLKLIKQIKKIKPDLIHLHNIHGSFFNHQMFFNYLSNTNIPVVWTFHDMWPITGLCCANRGCNKWITGCYKCNKRNNYPKTFIIDTSKKIWKQKKEMFNKINKLTIVSPSNNIINLIKESYLKDKSTVLINNGIDISIFKPTDNSFKKDHNIENKFMILCCANYWIKEKGLEYIIKLGKELDNNFSIVMVGTNNKVDNLLPKNIISIHKTNSKEDLAKIYSAADLFVNPTLNDNYPTVNLESIACGTPVVTFKVGGTFEMIDNKTGSAVELGNYDALKKEIIRIYNEKPFKKEDCLLKAKSFNKNDKYNEYLNLFNKILNI